MLYFIIKKRKSKEVYFLIGLLAAYISISITNFFGFSISIIQVFFYLIPAVLIVMTQEELPAKSINVSFKGIFDTAAKGAVILVLCIWTIYLARYYLADITYAEADTLQRSGQYQDAFTGYETALALRYEHVYEDKLSTTLANLAFISSFQEDKELSQNLVEVSKYFNEHSLKESSKNVLYWKTRAKNYYLFYQMTLDTKNLETAIFSMEYAQQLSPTDPKIPYTTALFYSLAAEEAKDPKQQEVFKRAAADELQKSITLKKDYEDAIILLKSLDAKKEL
jgi:tetratricopeptide (TPR) repeat protein